MWKTILTLSIIVSSAGCASWSTFNKERGFTDAQPNAVFIDAKQRAILSNFKPHTNNAEAGVRRYCAEPSPDALSAFAAQAGLNLSLPTKGDLGYSQAFSEGAASIGLRTQSIQLLRDIMFTNCEAFINEGITSFGLETLQRRFQSTMVAVLAIEQLTGVVKAPAVTLGGTARGSDAQVLSDAIKLLDSAQSANDLARSEQTTADAAATTANATFAAFKVATPKDTSSAEYLAAKGDAEKAAKVASEAKATVLKRQGDLADAKTLRAAAMTAGGAAAVNVQVATDPADQAADAANKAAVAEAVVNIVNSTLQLGFGREICTTLFGQIIGAPEKALPPTFVEERSKLASKCLDYLEQNIAAARVANANTAAINDSILRSMTLMEVTLKTAPLSTADERLKITEAIKEHLKGLPQKGTSGSQLSSELLIPFEPYRFPSKKRRGANVPTDDTGWTVWIGPNAVPSAPAKPDNQKK